MDFGAVVAQLQATCLTAGAEFFQSQCLRVVSIRSCYQAPSSAMIGGNGYHIGPDVAEDLFEFTTSGGDLRAEEKRRASLQRNDAVRLECGLQRLEEFPGEEDL